MTIQSRNAQFYSTRSNVHPHKVFTLSYVRDGSLIEEEFLSELAAVGRAAVLMEAGMVAAAHIRSADGLTDLDETAIRTYLRRVVGGPSARRIGTKRDDSGS